MIFNEVYNRENFSEFLRDFLPEDFVEREQDLSHIDSCKVITQAIELGVSSSLGVHVLEMSHGKETDPRVAIATDAFRILATYQIDKALVIFNSNNSDNYRFSLLTISLDINEKNKLVKTYSNARRFSFYLGPGAKARTPEHQLISKSRVKDISDLVDRFSLEVVNKQFYLELAKHFDALVDKDKKFLSLPSQSDPNARKSFAMRLIGRIMFCWFLKQKHSPTDGPLIPDALLSSKAVQDAYYHNVLEPLFFGILNTPLEGRDIRGELYDSVPYLNGGLFNPQYDDFYDLDREILVSKHINTLVISDKWFRDFFSLLETYNFTIDENTVFDQELSVDPEMLGRIFENLLAEINPETGSSERKRTGSYYTPRQIVEYMVDRALVEHLKSKTGINEEKLEALVSYDLSDDSKNPLELPERKAVIDALDSLRLLDPACGSGAFPIGALQKIVWILQRVDADCELWLEKKLAKVPELYRQKIRKDSTTNPFDYTRKLDVIKNSIFGVDIQPIAVEIARLRCFLTLVVESEVNDTKLNRGVEPLPNLDFKFVCANTLIPAPGENGGENRLFTDDFEEKLSTAVDRYFSSFGASKSSAGNDIHRLIDSKVDEQLRRVQNLIAHSDERYQAALAKTNKKSIDTQTRVLTLWASYKNLFENKPVGFFDPKYFFPGVKDGFDIVIGNPPYNAELTDTERKFYKNTYKSVSSGRQDTSAIFYEFAERILTEGGVLAYILPYRLFSRLRNHGAFQMFALSESEILQILYLGSNIGFSASDEFMIVLAKSQANPSEDHEICIFRKPDLHNIGESKSNIIKQSIFRDNREVNLNLASYDTDVLKKLETDSLLLDKLCHVKDGIVPFIREKLVSDKKVDDRYVRFAGIAGTYELKPYYFKTDDLYLCYDLEEAKKYIHNPIELRKVQLRDRNIFLQRKIVTAQNSALLKGCIDEQKLFVSNSLHSTYLRKETKEDYTLEYILGLLNSPLMNYYHNSLRVKATDLHPQILVGNLKKLPIKIIDKNNKKTVSEIESLVTQILSLKKQDSQADTTQLETQINHLVYKLYGLTEDEVKLVEQQNKS